LLLIVSLTGALYTFREELENWQQAELRCVSPIGERLPLSRQLGAVRERYPDWQTTRVIVFSNPRKATVIQVNKPGASSGAVPAVFVDPYTGAVLGEGEVRSPFFTIVLKLHRSLFAGTAGRVAVELTTSWTLVLLVTGVYLWWPKSWNLVRGVWWPRMRSHPYVAVRDLHAVLGVLLTPVIGVIAVTGLFFTVVWLASFNAVSRGAGNFPRELLSVPLKVDEVHKQSAVSVDDAVALARERFPQHTLTLTMPKTATEPYAFSARREADTALAGSVAIDPKSGQVLTEKHAEQLSWMKQARLYVLPVHMGTIGGTPTKVLACVACLVLAGLGLSGVAMWLVRRPRGRSGFPSASNASVPTPAVCAILILAVLLPTVGLSLIVVVFGEWFVDRLRSLWFPSVAASVVHTQEVSP
jgi:uncharacterized iron-regulated membrane protein